MISCQIESAQIDLMARMSIVPNEENRQHPFPPPGVEEDAFPVQRSRAKCSDGQRRPSMLTFNDMGREKMEPRRQSHARRTSVVRTITGP